jgi:hypothetical protein
MEAMIMNEPMQLAFEPQSYQRQAPRKRSRRTASIGIIRDHLVSKKTISPQQAMELYGITIGSLTGAISRLRNEEKWRIATVRPAKGSRDKLASYRLEAQKQAEPLVSSAAVAVDAICLRNGKDGPEIQILCEGEPDTKPFFKLRPDQLQYLTMNLTYFANTARKAQ